MASPKPRIAFIGTGGTMASLGKGPRDIQDYSATGQVMDAATVLARLPELAEVADVFALSHRASISTHLGFVDWRSLARSCSQLEAAEPGLAGIVIGHGTSLMEETAYALSLTLKTSLPVVMVGAQRPASALSSDASMNLLNAVRLAACPEARGMGVLVLLNDEIHTARDVAKTSTWRLQAFRAPDFGALGHADGDRIAFYRRPLRRAAPDTEFDIRDLPALPRVDIAYSHADADGTAIRAFVAAGAQGIVSAGFPPGSGTPGETEALREALAEGVVVVQSSRAGSGRVIQGRRMAQEGMLAADNLTPQKARILLALALTVTRDPAEITRIFGTY
ncbi:asparaginase [Roseomonas marmotae]|uniref:Asparaginase n=1 Tax=Roseomonas marmotae TaxID=2768161 RepID=A0ABS3KJW6_9PROT|nr:asparaginase [Roseomonas marmotae]MBO1076626.1 asparaginase [Roseomonas marmotae]QTI79632.1 asparaginase [Roseomonas marmotae]